jgi:adenylate cyclase
LGGAFPGREISRVAVVGRKEPVRIFEFFHEQGTAGRERVLAPFAAGLREFYAGRFSGAIDSFLQIESADRAAAAYVRKCRDLLDRPPERWEGVWTMTEK